MHGSTAKVFKYKFKHANLSHQANYILIKYAIHSLDKLENLETTKP